MNYKVTVTRLSDNEEVYNECFSSDFEARCRKIWLENDYPKDKFKIEISEVSSLG